jgi:hypothetical protein
MSPTPSEVVIGGKTVTVERFTLAKAMRVITLLQLIQKQMPEITKEWASFRRTYAEDYGVELDRINAMAQFGDQLEHIKDEQWERAGQKFKVPGTPSTPELFFAMAPLVYEKAEAVTLRLLGLIAMPNEVVGRYVAQGDIWERVDELVDDILKPAGLDEILELVITAAEVIDGQVLQKAKGLGDRAGNVARLLGIKTTTTMESPSSLMDSPTLSGPPEQPSSDSSSDSPSDTSGDQTESEPSPGMTPNDSAIESPVTA